MKTENIIIEPKETTLKDTFLILRKCSVRACNGSGIQKVTSTETGEVLYFLCKRCFNEFTKKEATVTRSGNQ